MKTKHKLLSISIISLFMILIIINLPSSGKKTENKSIDKKDPCLTYKTWEIGPLCEHDIWHAEQEEYILKPYMSTEQKEWVFTHIVPIKTDEGKIEGFYQYDEPIRLLQETLSEKHAERTFILHSANHIIADNRQEINSKLKEGANPEDQKLEDYFPPPDSISTTTEFMDIISKMSQGEEGCEKYVENDKTYYVVFKPLMTFKGWSVGKIIPEQPT